MQYIPVDFIADILLGAGALGAGIYCMVLSRRLRQFNQLENGMGGAIAVLSAQVDDMTKALERARATASASASSLEGLNTRAQQSAERLELLLASLHDLPDPAEAQRRGVRVARKRHRHEGLEAAE
jgi:hypothetical protein